MNMLPFASVKKNKIYLQKKYLGLVGFITELLKFDLLPPDYILFWIENLLDKCDEKSIESLCELLRLVGKTMEQKFFKLRKLVTGEDTGSMDDGLTDNEIQILKVDKKRKKLRPSKMKKAFEYKYKRFSQALKTFNEIVVNYDNSQRIIPDRVRIEINEILYLRNRICEEKVESQRDPSSLQYVENVNLRVNEMEIFENDLPENCGQEEMVQNESPTSDQVEDFIQDDEDEEASEVSLDEYQEKKDEIKFLTPDQVRHAAKDLLVQFLDGLNLDETASSLQESFHGTDLKYFVMGILHAAFTTRGDEPKHSVGKLLTIFIENNDISKDQFLDGFSYFLMGVASVLATVKDFDVDLPVGKYLAQILLPLWSSDVLSLSDVVLILRPIKGTKVSAKFLKTFFGILIEDKGNDWVEEKWIASNVSFDDIINPDDVENFLKENNLEFLSTTEVFKTAQSELCRMMCAKESFYSIKIWIDRNVGVVKSGTPEFTRILISAILESVVNNQCSNYLLDDDLLARYESLIRWYTNDKDKKLHCLYAVQNFACKMEHLEVTELVSSVFKFFFDSELIPKESFESWRNSEDPREIEGRALCIESLNSLFLQLSKENTDENFDS